MYQKGKRRGNNSDRLKTIYIFVIFAVSLALGLPGMSKADCASNASISVTTGQPAYTPGEYVTGDIFFTNNTGAPLYIDATGNIYDSTSSLVLTNSVSATVPDGTNSYSLSDLFGSIYIDPSVPTGDYTIEVKVSAPLEACAWDDTAAATIASAIHNVPGDFAKIQEAIDYASDGDLILVDDGTYPENIKFNGKAITVRSVNGPTVTTIDGGAAGSVVTFNGGEGLDSVIDGFTITNGLASFGGGIRVSDSSPKITNCNISNNSSSFGGGIHGGFQSSLMITNCTITGNSAGDGGGIDCGSSSSSTITNCTITGNSATKGGGINCGSSSSTITNCIISDNTAHNGGGIACYYSSPTITNCTITGNSATLGGGGIGCYSSSPTITTPTITNCTITGNSAFLSGGGIECISSSPTITNCTISNNTAAASDGGGINCFSSSLTITNCTISNNTASFDGGGIDCYSSSPTITNCTITGNSALSGGGIFCTDSSPTITNCNISNNSADDQGGGIAFFSSPSPTITNSTITGNSASLRGGGICCSDSSPTITNTILWADTATTDGNEVYVYSGSPVFTYCNIQGGYPGIGNIDAYPLFVDAAGGDYHLLFGSPCINTGTDDTVTYPSLPYDDIDGNTRPEGIARDMGTDETSGIDSDGDGVFSDHDCDDSDPDVYPGAAEICGDGIDNNCDGQTDEGC